jgi:dTMP kinase
LYGINNIGKTTQSDLLANFLEEKGLDVEQIKLPDYALEPSGPKLYSLLRLGKQEISEKELQLLFIENLKQLQPVIQKLLDKGVYVIFEDYYASTLAWGSAKGLDLEWLKNETSFAIKEDLAILLDGKRFVFAKEQGHIHEQNDAVMEKARKQFLGLAKEFGWKIIRANQDKEKVRQQIVEEVKKII